jgi:hypothetical protein
VDKEDKVTQHEKEEVKELRAVENTAQIEIETSEVLKNATEIKNENYTEEIETDQ